MSNDQRRHFLKLCAAAVAAVGAKPHLLDAAAAAPEHTYQRTRLTWPDGAPLRTAELVAGESYVFHYPFVATPCFLLDLGDVAITPTNLRTEDGASYRWQGGVGPARSIVAFSAICAHKMSHPARAVSFINYRADEATFVDGDERRQRRQNVIYCCSEKSVYDPTRGAQVLGGPAPQPLAAVTLEYDAGTDELIATGTRGGEMFEKFFDTFAFRLQLEHKLVDVRAPSPSSTSVHRLAEYCSNRVTC